MYVQCNVLMAHTCACLTHADYTTCAIRATVLQSSLQQCTVHLACTSSGNSGAQCTALSVNYVTTLSIVTTVLDTIRVGTALIVSSKIVATLLDTIRVGTGHVHNAMWRVITVCTLAQVLHKWNISYTNYVIQYLEVSNSNALYDCIVFKYATQLQRALPFLWTIKVHSEKL